LFKLPIEPVTKPFVDKYSFGFQKGKRARLAIGEIAAILNMKIERVRKVCDNKKPTTLELIIFSSKNGHDFVINYQISNYPPHWYDIAQHIFTHMNCIFR
jgi:hypothetical protein